MQTGFVGFVVVVAVVSSVSWAARGAGAEERRIRAASGQSGPAWATFEMDDLRAARAASGRAYLDFLGASTLSTGLYALPAGGVDEQSPHDRDEVYHVLRGRATLVVGDDRRPVAPGSVAFVAAGAPHRFVDIEEDLELLVFFSSAEPIDPEDGASSEEEE